MKTQVIAIGMLVIISLALPAISAGGGGDDDSLPAAPEESPDPDRAAAPGTPGGTAGHEPQGPRTPNMPSAPSGPEAPDRPEAPTTPDCLRIYTGPCPQPGGEDPEEQPEPEAPRDGPDAPTAPSPDTEPVDEVIEDVPEPAAVRSEGEGIILGILAPVQAVADRATGEAKAVLGDVVATAGFAADQAARQVQDQVETAVGFTAHASGFVNGLLFGLLGTDAPAEGGSDDGTLTTSALEAGVTERPVGIVTMGLVAAGGLGLIAAGFAGLRRLLGLGGAAFLSRIPSKDIMKNDTRASIYDIVQSDPGVSLNEIVDRLGLSRNAVAYHLAVFESEKQVVSVKDGKYRRYFINGGKYVNGAKDVVSTIKNDVTLNVARFILDHPGVMQKEVCSAVGTSPSATNWHITRLEKVGLIEKEKVANTVRYTPGPSFNKYDLAEFGLVTPQLA